ncbi:NADH-dependent flavin oxidoreductase [Sulfurimicrobium lacus]|uniref:NADH-dependent flavin oxidoreductase n=1 Tax=Sulfurimicrobium lacus TaxID=2715678 RepID=A0A6F8VHC6_9PROT|nr:NADH:flavin oxidoreductase/NADH oxidase [Sulfurimicrobium lacus]BCB28571.1 NADH-dependent flavin oxidoreductase [Sulfurimicrobium lacus]
MVSKLFSPIALGDLALSNRIVISPMCQYSAEHGQATDWHLIHLGQLALSGAALLFIEATAVAPEGRISPNDLGLWSDKTEAALARVIQSIRHYSAMPIAIQLAHAGRKASTRVPWEGGQSLVPESGGWQTMAPSALPYAEGDPHPLALGDEDLKRIRNDFVSAAQRLGVDVIELHAAHGYLLHQFLSPLSNVRNGRYGGSPENRMRFPLEVFDAMRNALPDRPIGVRISATDWVAGGWDIEQSVVFAKELQRRGCAFIDVSSGGLSPLQQIPVEPGYQVPFAERIRRETGLVTIAVGLITEAEQAETIVSSGQADMVALARGMLYDPRWPWHAAAKLGAQVDAPKQYWRSQPREFKNLFKQG